MAQFITRYEILEEEEDDDDDNDRNGQQTNMLTLWKRDSTMMNEDAIKETCPPIFGPVDISTEHGQSELSTFFSEMSGVTVKCVVAKSSKSSTTKEHTHQF
eukprot:4129285-Ditylum_brightwellii.AAC.1